MTTSARPRPVTITIDDARSVSGLLQVPKNAHICYVLAHGAGAGMSHPFIAAIANGLVARGMATLRYQFPYMEQGAKRPDVPKLAQATVRAAVAEAATLVPELGLVTGGKSFGGRMTSLAQAASPLPGVRGLVFLGFPLHPPGRPSDERAKHLFEVKIPMLFLQGNRDAARGHEANAGTDQTARHAGNPQAISRCRPFISCACARRPSGFRGQSRDVGYLGRLD